MITSLLYDYKLPTKKEDQPKFFDIWQNLHLTDHQRFVSILNELNKQFNYPQIKLNAFQLYFKPDQTETINQFLAYNEKLHKIIYDNLNTLGLKLTPPLIMKPRLNSIKRIKTLNSKEIALFLLMEERIHLLTARAFNLLYEFLK